MGDGNIIIIIDDNVINAIIVGMNRQVLKILCYVMWCEAFESIIQLRLLELLAIKWAYDSSEKVNWEQEVLVK